jgi:translation initiation factor IF-2
LTVKSLADVLGLSPVQVIKELMKNGLIANINQAVDQDTAVIVATDLGYEVVEPSVPVLTDHQVEEARPSREALLEEDEDLLEARPPIVTVLGHVDHGKTSLLDAVRKTNVASGEAGGITQHIGAYQVEIHGNKITFLDTPGHEAFTAMRARGAQATDIAILVVAADDGVMPQTREAIDHVKAAGVPMVVALNKIDKPNANPDRVKQQLSEVGVLPREYGGDIELVPVSAKTREGVEELLETVLLVSEADVNPRANPNRDAIGVVIEAKMDKTRGPVATVLVQTGTLHLGAVVVVGTTYGKVKALFNDRGKRIKQAGPATPVEILGLNGLPMAGDRLRVVPDERTARLEIEAGQVAAQREAGRPEVTLEDIYSRIKAGEVKELNVIVKTDVQGSLEPIVSSLDKIDESGARVKIIHAGTGNVTGSDVMLAAASKAVIIGFNVRPESGAREVAEVQKVDIRYYDVIYGVVDDVRKALQGMLEPTVREVVQGHAEVRQVFKVGKGAVAGCYVLDGQITRNSLARVQRNGQALAETRVGTLRRFKDDVREVNAGYECGIGLDAFSDFQEGDVIEAYVRQTD